MSLWTHPAQQVAPQAHFSFLMLRVHTFFQSAGGPKVPGRGRFRQRPLPPSVVSRATCWASIVRSGVKVCCDHALKDLEIHLGQGGDVQTHCPSLVRTELLQFIGECLLKTPL